MSSPAQMTSMPPWMAVDIWHACAGSRAQGPEFSSTLPRKPVAPPQSSTSFQNRPLPPSFCLHQPVSRRGLAGNLNRHEEGRPEEGVAPTATAEEPLSSACPNQEEHRSTQPWTQRRALWWCKAPSVVDGSVRCCSRHSFSTGEVPQPKPGLKRVTVRSRTRCAVVQPVGAAGACWRCCHWIDSPVLDDTGCCALEGKPDKPLISACTECTPESTSWPRSCWRCLGSYCWVTPWPACWGGRPAGAKHASRFGRASRRSAR